MIEELQTDVWVVTDTSAVTGANLFFCDEPSRLAKILARLYVYASRQQLHGAAGALPGCSRLSLSVLYCQHVPSSVLLWCCVLLHFLQLSTSSSWIPGIGDMPNGLVSFMVIWQQLVYFSTCTLWAWRLQVFTAIGRWEAVCGPISLTIRRALQDQRSAHPLFRGSWGWFEFVYALTVRSAMSMREKVAIYLNHLRPIVRRCGLTHTTHRACEMMMGPMLW